MVALVVDATTRANVDASRLRNQLSALAANAFVDADGIGAVVADGWWQAVESAVSADGTLTEANERRLRAFGERLAVDADTSEAATQAWEQMNENAQRRLTFLARAAALATADTASRLQALDDAVATSGLPQLRTWSLLAQNWQLAVDEALEDHVLTHDEERALRRYLGQFDLADVDVDTRGGYTKMVRAAIIRDVADGVVPERLELERPPPFNLMKSEHLVWLFDDVEYYEVKTRRERRGGSHGVSIRVAKGLYYSPRVSKSHSVEWEETVHEDTGLMGVTTKHIYFHGSRKRFRIRYDRIVSMEGFEDGLEVMRDAQTAKPQLFRTGDGWFTHNLVANLAQNA